MTIDELITPSEKFDLVTEKNNIARFDLAALSYRGLRVNWGPHFMSFIAAILCKRIANLEQSFFCGEANAEWQGCRS